MKDFIIRIFFLLIIFGFLLFVLPAFFNYDLFEDYENTNRNLLILFTVPLFGAWGCWYVYKAIRKKKK